MLSKEEKALLYKDNTCYLWNKNRRNWTEEDLENLKNGTYENKKPIRTKKNKTTKVRMQKVKILRDGVFTVCESVVKASIETGVQYQTVMRIVNNKQKQLETIKFYKIQ